MKAIATSSLLAIAILAGHATHAAANCTRDSLRGNWLINGLWGVVTRFDGTPGGLLLDSYELSCDVKILRPNGFASGTCKRGFYGSGDMRIELNIDRECKISGRGHLKVPKQQAFPDPYGKNWQSIDGWMNAAGDQVVLVLEQDVEGKTIRTGTMIGYRRP